MKRYSIFLSRLEKLRVSSVQENGLDITRMFGGCIFDIK